ncbi:MAG TPA: NHLP leader peptide family RiPP precursor [Thermoanaerobaculaceae bacterium]|nr:NHLP leader peptide family RiPP precursor [Thermoanaerobaculaceae bacterium]
MIQKDNDAEALRRRLLDRAASDAEFRRALLARPKATVEREFEVTLDPRLEIHVVEETAERICLVLPARARAGEGAELSDGDMENVAGGAMPEPIPYRACGFDRLSNVLGDRGMVRALTPIQIP